MNLEGLVDWGVKTLALLNDRSRMEQLGLPAELVRAKLGLAGGIPHGVWGNGRPGSP